MTTPMRDARLWELAKGAAQWAHDDNVCATGSHPSALHIDPFTECQHPDCLLVRAQPDAEALPTPAKALERLKATFVAYRDAPMKPSPELHPRGSKIEVNTIRRTLNVVVYEIEREIAALKAPPSPSTPAWQPQPIETAPRNANEVLVRYMAGGVHGKPGQSVWISAHFAHGDGDGMMPAFGPSWFYWSGYDYREIVPAPIEWLPSPEASAAQTPDGPKHITRDTQAMQDLEDFALGLQDASLWMIVQRLRREASAAPSAQNGEKR